MKINWQKETRHFLFVYGSLKRSGMFHNLIQDEVELLNSDCYTRGILISLGKYPAMIDGIGKVKGELLSITSKGLSICNRIEGYKPGKYSFYYPVHKSVYEPDGYYVGDALVYIINPLNISFNWFNSDLEIGIDRVS